jgi:hypothetical protein
LKQKGENMKTTMGAILLLGAQALAGGLQGGVNSADYQSILLERAKLEVLTKSTGNIDLIEKLAQQKVSLADIKSASSSATVDALGPKMGRSTSTNRGLVAEALATEAGLDASLTGELVTSASSQTTEGDFLTGPELADLYKPVAVFQPVQLGTPTIAGSLCDASKAYVYVHRKSQVINIIIASGLVVDPLSKPLERGTCLLSVPVMKPVGKALVFDSVDVHGIAAKHGNAKLQLELEAFVSGDEGDKVPLVLLPIDDSTLAHRFSLSVASTKAFAQDKDSALLRLNLSALAIRQSQDAIGIIGLDRISIRYSLQ